MTSRPDILVILTDEERAPPAYESAELRHWRESTLLGRRWFAEHGVSFERHYTGSLACAPSRPTLFTGQYPDVHGVTQTNGFGKLADDSRTRWLRPGEVPTLGHFFRAAGYDTHYDGKWHMSRADLKDHATGETLDTKHGRRRRDRFSRASLSRCGPASRLRVHRLGRPRAARPQALEQRTASRSATCRAHRGVARGSLRAPQGR